MSKPLALRIHYNQAEDQRLCTEAKQQGMLSVRGRIRSSLTRGEDGFYDF